MLLSNYEISKVSEHFKELFLGHIIQSIEFDSLKLLKNNKLYIFYTVKSYDSIHELNTTNLIGFDLYQENIFNYFNNINL